MQFNSPRQKVTNAVAASKNRKTLGFTDTSKNVSGKINISMYHTPPLEDITLTEFDEIAQERLSILRFIEDTKERHTFGSDEYTKDLENKMRSSFPIANLASGLPTTQLNHWKRRDNIGHFILRLAFCRNPEQMKWFINQEVDFFRYRLKQLDEYFSLQAEFLKMNDLNIQVVSKEEQHELQPLLDVSFGTIDPISTMHCYFKLPFTDAFDLIRRRKVLLRRGMAYIHNESLATALCGTLRAQMMATMTNAFKQLAMLEEENRIFPRLARLANNAYTGKTYEGNEKGDKISRHQLDQLCGASFPPCMKQIHQRFRSEHHLRHGARRQYGLFLKGIGLSLEEALAFMREEFTKKMDSDKFEKQYAYNVRHMYGKEGKRVGYPALPCSTIILSNPPAAGDCHGCPFKHTDQGLLAQRLAKDNLTKEQVNQVIEFTKVSAYDKACTRFFEFSHKMESGALGQLIVHPNQFYELSKEVLSGTRAKDNHIHMSQAQPKQKSDFNPFPVALKTFDDDDDDF